MTDPAKGIATTLRRWATRFKSSTLAMFLASLFVLDVFIPDFLPFVDEIVLGIAAILVARWQARRAEPPMAPKPPPKNVTPRTD